MLYIRSLNIEFPLYVHLLAYGTRYFFYLGGGGGHKPYKKSQAGSGHSPSARPHLSILLFQSLIWMRDLGVYEISYKLKFHRKAGYNNYIHFGQFEIKADEI